MEKKLHLFHGEDNLSGNSSESTRVNRIDEAVAEARDVCLASSNIVVNQAFFMTSGFNPVYFALSLSR